MKEILIKSTYDHTAQPCLVHLAEGSDPAPLLVGLHTWSYDRFNQIKNLLPMAIRNNWYLILPEFRGPNLMSNPHAELACGSKAAKQDIIDAVEYMKKEHQVDEKNILLIGASGGGHMALLMAAYEPTLWKAVCSLCPLTDVRRWHDERQEAMDKPGSESYVKGIEACCKGAPCDDNVGEYMYRSPMSYVNEIAQANVKIFHGKFDTSISYLHSLDLFTEITKKHPQSRVFLDLFDGPHIMHPDVAEKWFKEQMGINANNEENRVTG